MNIEYNQPLSKKSEIVLKSLQRAVSKALERKRKLGQYAVLWDGEKVEKKWLDDESTEKLSSEN